MVSWYWLIAAALGGGIIGFVIGVIVVNIAVQNEWACAFGWRL